jgi:uncharacterized protein YunC (DUF1805 family)
MSRRSAPSLHRLPVAAFGCLLGLTLGCAAGTHHPSAPADADAGRMPAAEPTDPWRGLERHELQLGQKLLVVKGKKGVIGCPYLDVAMFERSGEACAIIPAIDTAGMLLAKVKAVTTKARELGIEVGMSGREALDRIR